MRRNSTTSNSWSGVSVVLSVCGRWERSLKFSCPFPLARGGNSDVVQAGQCRDTCRWGIDFKPRSSGCLGALMVLTYDFIALCNDSILSCINWRPLNSGQLRTGIWLHVTGQLWRITQTQSLGAATSGRTSTASIVGAPWSHSQKFTLRAQPVEESRCICALAYSKLNNHINKDGIYLAVKIVSGGVLFSQLSRMHVLQCKTWPQDSGFTECI